MNRQMIGAMSAAVGPDKAGAIPQQASFVPLDHENRVRRLTPLQIDVLKLVASLRTSKEIARELGIAPVTVDQRVKRALAILGVDNRREAARVLIAAWNVPN